MTRLYDIATARAGDKGNTSNIAVFVHDPAHWPAVRNQLTAEVVRASYPALFRGMVTRYVLDHLNCLNFVLEQALEGGVSDSLNLDGHGKSFSFLVLELDITLPASGDQNGETP